MQIFHYQTLFVNLMMFPASINNKWSNPIDSPNRRTIKTIRHGSDIHENQRNPDVSSITDPSIAIRHGPLSQYLKATDRVQTKIFFDQVTH
jgi:hypothetical protein